ncbi:hypothetical protein AS156_25765 [Bradyrhizobium macuxiense]|uniref:Uncharacterized protein n=1 Tax=Bradyrhizobium macuxiense TaxID=1755647 RepID=A0A125QAP2_9BRAD|nr:hypothetical protein [Bradyrhizobium macuxiense]KWV61127.1 hypothetical protein AS156_25765 [Bradyrhizobium macuxiense]
MSNVVQLADYRARVASVHRCPIAYADAIKWAAKDFDRLVWLCKDRGYRPGWIIEQFGGGAKRLSPMQAAIVAKLSAVVGPACLNHRMRWLIYKLADGVFDDALIEAARTAVPYADCKYIAHCVGNDLRKIEILIDDGDVALPLSAAM